MTIILPISMNDTTEAFGGPFTPTLMTQRFAAMQVALADYLDAERDLEHSGAWDPACDHWLRDAEAARTGLAATLDAVCATEPTRVQDQPLRQMARIARVMLLASDEVEFARAYGLLDQFDAVLRCDGHAPLDRHINAMLAKTRQQLAAVAALPDYALDAGDAVFGDLLPEPVTDSDLVPDAVIDRAASIAPVTDLSDWLLRPLGAPADLFQTSGMVQQSSVAPVDMTQMPSSAQPDQPGAAAA